jgi:hypothetical protein
MKYSSFAASCHLLVLLVLLNTVPGQAQTPPAKAAADSSSASLGFSIESEMLTYRALESNSEAVACDITAYLNRTSPDFNSHPDGAVCDVKAGSHSASVVLLPFDKSTFADFQIWRADMAAMDQLLQEPGRGATAAAGSALDLTPAGPMINAAQGVLGLLASEEATSPVKGTVEDQAFLNGVGRQLLSLKVPVIMPTGYSPYSLMPLDRRDSPFIVSLDRTLKAEVCLARLAANKGEDSEIIQSTIAEIEKFRDMLEDLAMAKPPAAAATKTPGESATAPTTQGGSTAAPTTPGGSTTAPTTQAVTAASSSDHLHAVLFADGLARALGWDASGEIPESVATQHILLLKALESGGSVSRSSNILGTKLRYSGGFVGSYALFTMEGELECSGNVFEFGGPVKGKHFDQELNNHPIEPGKQIIFQRGNCLNSARRH